MYILRLLPASGWWVGVSDAGGDSCDSSNRNGASITAETKVGGVLVPAFKVEWIVCGINANY